MKLMIWGIRLSLRVMVSYEFTPESLNVYNFWVFRRLRLKYGDIASVTRIPDINQRGPLPPFTTVLDVTDRLFGEGVVIEKKTGAFMYAVFSPEDPDGFLTRLERFRKLAAKEAAEAADPSKRRRRQKVMDGGPAHLPDD